MAPRTGVLTRRFVLGLAVTLVAVSNLVAQPVAAHVFSDCQSRDLYATDPGCRAHWYANQMLWHWGPNIDTAEHQGHKDAYKRSVAGWEAEIPDSPWNAKKDPDGETHPDVIDASGFVLGRGRIAQEDIEDHLPRVIELWVRHDVEELDCGAAAGFQACSWYNGEGSPGALQIDEWGVWQEELGHAQNVSHHVLAGHEAHGHEHTMSGTAEAGSITKREPWTHENEHACYGYEIAHGASC